MKEDDDMNETEKKELALSKVVLIILAGIGLAAVVWFAWWLPASRDRDIHSFQACAEAGNPVQESDPEVCVTESGKRFENPDQLD